MRSLILISVVSILISGCHFSLVHSWHRVKEVDSNVNLNSYFQNTDSNYLYLADIRFMKNYYSGIVAIKPMKDSLHRVVFVTEMGMKIFDMEIRNPWRNKDFYTVYYMIEPMSKKIIQNTLARDFGMLLQNPTKEKIVQYEGKSEEKISRIKDKRMRYYYIFDNKQVNYHKIFVESPCFKKAEIDYFSIKNNYPDSIKIKHMGIRLQYIFRKLKQ